MKEAKSSCENSIPAEIEKMLKQITNSLVKREGFLSYEVIKKSVNSKGGGYMGEPFEIDVKGHTSKGEKEINIFVKHMIPNTKLDGFFSVRNAYLTECFVYNELSKVIEKLQEDAGIPAEERFKMIKGFEESNSAAIVLDNVSRKGYEMLNRMEVASLEFIKLSIEQVAKLHGLGFVIEKTMPEYFNRKILPMRYPILLNDSWEAMTENLLNVSIKNLSPEAKKKAKDFRYSIFLSSYKKHLLNRSKINTLSHGDFRANNILLKEVDGKINEIIPIDYQTIHYGYPVNDILHIIYGCTDQNFRKNHKTYLIDFYYQTLTRFLSKFKIDVNEVYPRQEFDKVLREKRDYGLIIALYFFPIYFATDDDVPDFTKEESSAMEFDLPPKILKRLEEIIDEYYI